MSALAIPTNQSRYVKLTLRIPNRSQYSMMPERGSGHLLQEDENTKPAKSGIYRVQKTPTPPKIFLGIQIWG